MPKDKSEQPVGPLTAEYRFVVRSLTARDAQKVPGATKYSSRETGVPYITVDLDWPGRLAVKVPGVEGVPDLEDPVVMGLAFQAMLRWVNENAAAAGRKVVADIKLDRLDAALDDMPGADIEL